MFSKYAKQLTFSSIAIALAMVTGFIKLGSLPFGGSITLFSMFFICFTGYLFGVKAGLAAGAAYGVLQFLVEPYVFHPVQVLLDFPLAFGALGLAGIFSNSKAGLIKGLLLGMTGRYVCHVISGYIFFADYAENSNAIVYTLGYNATYIVPEMVATVILVSIPPVAGALKEVKQMVLQP